MTLMEMPVVTASAESTLELVVEQVRREADGVVSLTLADALGRDLPAWTPGAHLELVLPSGLIRQYSLCGDCADRSRYVVAVLREDHGRGGSREIHDVGLVGRTLIVRGPRNHFALEPAARYLFLAGGIGVTPILAMVREAARAGADWQLWYGGRARARMAFVDELAAIDAARVHVRPEETDGLLPVRDLIAEADATTAVYCCGPEPMIEAVTAACDTLGRGSQLHLERFGPGGDGVDLRDATAFEVELRRTGVTLQVPADRTVLDVVREVVEDVAYSCEEGYCGSCETGVVEGTPDHRDTVLSDEERAGCDRMMICVSRSCSRRLVLDL
jgi:ferredoxin-NADP reductase